MAVEIGCAITQPTIFSRWRALGLLVTEPTDADLVALEAGGVRRKRYVLESAKVCAVRGGDDSARLIVSNSVTSCADFFSTFNVTNSALSVLFSEDRGGMGGTFAPILPVTLVLTDKILPSEPSLSLIPDSISMTLCFALSLISSLVHSSPR